MSTYAPRMVLDLPSGEEYAQKIVDAADLDRGERRRFDISGDPPSGVDAVVHQVVAKALGPEASTEIGEVVRIEWTASRVTVVLEVVVA